MVMAKDINIKCDKTSPSSDLYYPSMVLFSQNEEDSRLMNEYVEWRDSLPVYSYKYILLDLVQLMIFANEKIELPELSDATIFKLIRVITNYLQTQFVEIDRVPFSVVYDTIQKMILIYCDKVAVEVE